MKIEKKTICNKKTLYIFCFVAISLIEVIRNSAFVEMEVPTGVIRLTEVLGGLKIQDLWYVVANCTGIVMMVIVFSAYNLKSFFTVANGVWTLVCIGCMVFLPFHKQFSGCNYHLWQVEVAVINVWWLFIIYKCILRKMFIEKSIKINWNAKSILWATMVFFMAVSVNENKVWPVWYFFMFGAFYLTEYSKEDKEKLWDGMMDGSILAFCGIQTMAFFLRPYDELRYMGIHYNCNMAGLYYLIIYVILLLKMNCLVMENAAKWRKILCLLLAGVALSLQFMTMCRTAWLCSIIVTFLYGILVVKKIWEKTWKQTLISGAAIVLSMVMTFLPVFMAARWLPTTLPIRVWYDGEWGVPTKISMEEPTDSDKYTEIDEFLENALGRLNIFKYMPKLLKTDTTMPGVAVVQMNYESAEVVALEWLKDEGLRQRLSIYEAYLDDVKVFGNSRVKGYYFFDNGAFQSWHAQNIWLQIAYYYGGITGGILIALTFVLFIYSYKQMSKMKRNPYAIIPFFIFVIYFGFGTMEVVWNLGQMILFLVFFVNVPINNNLIKEGSMGSEK